MQVGEGVTTCYWLEPTGFGRVLLRRFTYTGGGHGHDAQVLTELRRKIPYRQTEHGKVQKSVPKNLEPGHRSRLWPSRCEECGERFPRSATWQTAWATEYVRSDTGEKVWARNVMGEEWAGALLDAWWLHDFKWRCSDGSLWDNVGPDGISLTAVCPNGAAWTVDGPARSNGETKPVGWTRTGDPRKPETLSASPSIIAGDYHGFLVNGVFSAHIG